MPSFEIVPVGVVESPLKHRKDAPRQPDQGAPRAWLSFAPEMAEALDGLKPGDRVIVLTWLHGAHRDVRRVVPRTEPERGETGVFSTRSPDRPNPIGLHETEIVAIDGLRVQVSRLEAIDGTPVVDVKPVLERRVGDR